MPLITPEARLESDLTRDNEQPANEGRVLHDPDGKPRYLGESSGATFLDSVKEFMTTLFPSAFAEDGYGIRSPGAAFVGSVGSYQTHDSRPLPSANTESMPTPSITEISIMLLTLRYHVQDGNGDFPCGGIYYWTDFDQIIQGLKMSSPHAVGSEAPHSLATLHAALAVSTLTSPLAGPSSITTSQQYLAKAKQLLGNPLDSTGIDDVKVLGLIALCLMEMNRRDSAYIHIGVAAHILYMHGVHRGWTVDEAGKRLFWTIYIVERRLSIMMGRPSVFLDDAITLSSPQPIDSLPPPDGLRAHIELSRISNYVLCNIYRVAPTGGQRQPPTAHIDEALRMLSKWAAELPESLGLPMSGVIADRAACELHMMYNQLRILVLRPILLTAVKRAVAGIWMQSGSTIDDRTQVSRSRECMIAATEILDLAKRMFTQDSPHKTLHSWLHYIFNAAVVSLLYLSVFEPWDDHGEHRVNFATEIFQGAADPTDYYTSDCLRVLIDLASLLRQLRREIDYSTTANLSARNRPTADEEHAAKSFPSNENHEPYFNGLNLPLDELTAWLQGTGDDTWLY